MKKIRFNQTTLSKLITTGEHVTVNDSVENGLRFKVGARRSVFQFEKRIRGHKGSPVTITIGAFPTISIDEARQEARRLANLCEKGHDPRVPCNSQESPVVTFGMIVDKFFQVKDQLAKKTQEKYRSVIKRLPDPWFDLNICNITPEMIVEQFHQFRVHANELPWEFLKIFSNLWNTCAPFYRDGKGNRILKVSPIQEARSMLKSISRPNPRRAFISVSQLGKFVATAEEMAKTSKGTRRGLTRIALVALFTAFRFNEARCLKWDYIDLKEGIICLPGFAEEGPFRGTKNGKSHTIPLSTYAWELFRQIHRERETLSPYVFPSRDDPSKPLSRHPAPFKMLSQAIGTYYSPHASRRTFASVANEVGLGYLDIKRLLNHDFQGGVTGGYVVPGFNPDSQRDRFQKICDFILDRRAEYLGEKEKIKGFNTDEALFSLNRYAIELGLDLKEALLKLTRKTSVA